MILLVIRIEEGSLKFYSKDCYGVLQPITNFLYIPAFFHSPINILTKEILVRCHHCDQNWISRDEDHLLQLETEKGLPICKFCQLRQARNKLFQMLWEEG